MAKTWELFHEERVGHLLARPASSGYLTFCRTESLKKDQTIESECLISCFQTFNWCPCGWLCPCIALHVHDGGYALASLTMRSARRSRMVYVYVPGTLAPELLGWPRTVCGFLCVFSALVNQQGQPHPQSMDSMKGLSEFEDLQYTSYHATRRFSGRCFATPQAEVI